MLVLALAWVYIYVGGGHRGDGHDWRGNRNFLPVLVLVATSGVVDVGVVLVGVDVGVSVAFQLCWH